MRSPPARDVNGGADERLPARRPASEPAPGGEALVGHLVDRLAATERELRAAQDRATAADAQRGLLARMARQLAEHETTPLPDLLRLALPMLGDWCIVECVGGTRAERAVAAAEVAREGAAEGLACTFELGSGASLLVDRVLRHGRAERLDALPPHALDESGARALDALGDGPVLLVPVRRQGAIVAAVAFGRIGDRDPYGAAEQRLAEELAGFVVIAMEQRRAAAAADEASRAKSEFLTMMSHELRTPLNAIAGYAQLLEMGFRGPLTDGQREAIGRILRGQEHLLELVDAVLTFSRLTSGRLQLDTGVVSAASLLDVARDPLAREFAERGIALEVRPCAADVRVLADQERAPQIVRHLLANALKFTEPGGQVSLTCECGDHTVRFVVADTGRGIPASQCEAIFQPFVQAEKGHTRSVDGSGLGLAIARELAERMGGTLAVTSEVGVGSRFVLTLRGIRD